MNGRVVECSAGAPAPSISAIVPVRNAAAYLSRSLPALREEVRELGGELLVIDDGSTDGSPDIVRNLGIPVIDSGGRLGAARARNLGVMHARAEVLVFVDADVAPAPGAISGLLAHLGSTEYAAAFGSYDDFSPERNFVSTYHNQRHHFYHQCGNPEADSFWSGLGVMRRRVFIESGGLDPDYEGIEDVELGVRLRLAGHRIRLDPSCQGTHLKHWTLWHALRTDVVKRALPWSRLLMKRSGARPTLNTGLPERARAAGALSLALTLLWAVLGQVSPAVPACAAAAVGAANLPFVCFLARREGVVFATAATLYHQIYYLYSAAVYLYCSCEELVASRLGNRVAKATGTHFGTGRF